MFRHLGRFLRFQIEADHHGAAFAHHAVLLHVHGTLVQRKTFIADVRYPRFDHDVVAVENRENKVGIDIGNHRHHLVGAVISLQHLVKVLLLAQVVVSKVSIIVDMAVAVDVVEANLHRQAVKKATSSCVASCV